MSRYRKAIATFFGVLTTWLATAMANGSISGDEAWGLVTAAAAAFAVYQIPNEPAWLRGVQKAIVAAVGAVGTWLTTALIDGHITHDEWLGLGSIVITVYATYQSLNTVPDSYPAEGGDLASDSATDSAT